MEVVLLDLAPTKLGLQRRNSLGNSPYKNWADLMTKTRELQERKKEWAEYYQNRGKVQSIRNYTIYIDKSY